MTDTEKIDVLTTALRNVSAATKCPTANDYHCPANNQCPKCIAMTALCRAYKPHIEFNPLWEAAACATAKQSKCAKSKRGAVMFLGNLMIGEASNSPPAGFKCGRDIECHDSCNKVAVHAEERLLMNFHPSVQGEYDLIHAKVDDDGNFCLSGPPSCWQCSRMIADSKIARIWLFHEDGGWTYYEADEFHRLTLEHCGLPVNESNRIDWGVGGS